MSTEWGRAPDPDDAEESTDPVEERDDEDDESFDVRDEMQAAFGEAPLRMVGGGYSTTEQGLPRPEIDDVLADAHAPPFLKENQVCIEDASDFVLRDGFGRVTARFQPSDVERLGVVRCVRPETVLRVLGVALPKRALSGGDKVLLVALGLAWAAVSVIVATQTKTPLAVLAAVPPALACFAIAKIGWRPKTAEDLVRECGIDLDGGWVVVRPKRPVCQHYVRQLDPLAPSEKMSGVLKYGWLRRYCSARRTVGGAFMDLTNREMAACSMREPYDVESDRLIRRFDTELEEKSRAREYLPMFNLVSQNIFGKEDNAKRDNGA